MVENGTLVGIHWNSHKKCWSVVNFKSRKTHTLLKCHMSVLYLKDISFKIDNSKKKKALEIGKKDRHTFIVGYLCDNIELGSTFDGKVKYCVNDNNEPFKDENGCSIIGKMLYFSQDGKVYKKCEEEFDEN